MLADCSFLLPLPQLACSILSTSYKYNFRALYSRGPLLGDSVWRETMMSSTTVHPSLVPGQSREGERENSFVHNRAQPCRTRSCGRRIRKEFQRYRHSLHSFVICDRRILFPFFLHPYLTLPLPCLTAFHTSKSPQTLIMSVARGPSPPFLPSHSLHIALPSPLSASSSSSLPPPPPRQ